MDKPVALRIPNRDAKGRFAESRPTFTEAELQAAIKDFQTKKEQNK